MEILRLIITLFGFVLGSILGSFAKALADRSLKFQTFFGRSKCPKCKHPLNWYDLFPILSYVLLKGQCRYCHKKLGNEYLLVELAVGILIGFLFYQETAYFQFSAVNFQFSLVLLDLVFKAFFVTILTALFLTDLKKMFIPDRIIITAIWISVGYLVVTTVYKIVYFYFLLNRTYLGKLLLPPHTDYFQRHSFMLAEPLLTGILLGIAVGGFFLALILATKGKGMGGGDVKLGAFMGLVLGFPNSLLALVVAFVSGAVISLVLIVGKKKHFKSQVPFGPFLVFGSLVALFWGDLIVNWYLKLGP